jgi:hypothetical protein
MQTTDDTTPGQFASRCEAFVFDGHWSARPASQIRLLRKEQLAAIDFSVEGPDFSTPASSTIFQTFPAVIEGDKQSLASQGTPVSVALYGAEGATAIQRRGKLTWTVAASWWNSKTATIVQLGLTESPHRPVLKDFATLAAKLIPASGA